MNRRAFVLTGTTLGAVTVAASLLRMRGEGGPSPAMASETFEIIKTPEEWRAILTDKQYAVLREEGTERAFTSPLNDEKRTGVFHCAGCDLPLYDSETKFDSGTGWPSFYEALPDAVGTKRDTSLFMIRTEVHCRRCGGHLGHVFDDGPPPTGKRHCINGISLTFRPKTA